MSIDYSLTKGRRSIFLCSCVLGSKPDKIDFILPSELVITTNFIAICNINIEHWQSITVDLQSDRSPEYGPDHIRTFRHHIGGIEDSVHTSFVTVSNPKLRTN